MRIKINCLDEVISRVQREISNSIDGDECLTMAAMSKRVGVDRKTLRKWARLGVIRVDKVKYSVTWAVDGGPLVASAPNGFYHMSLSRLLEDLLKYKCESQRDLNK